jgi:hypothetical protein
MKIVGSRINYGTYGRQMEVDEDGNEIELKVKTVKRSKRGRPRKDEVTEGNKFRVTPELYHAFGLLWKKEKSC